MNKVGLITGAASGLGFEFSKLLAQDSYDLIMVDINANLLKDSKEKILEQYKIVVGTIACDLSKPGVAEQVFREIGNREIDILINNAGFGLFGFFSETDWALEESMIYLHVLNMTHLTKLLVKKMISRQRGRILNVSSLAAFQPGPLMSIYYATKAYILSFSMALSNEVKGTGVTVTVLCPGQIKTNFENVSALNSKSKVSNTKFFSADPVKVAKYGYDAMNRGESVAIPGTVNKFLALLTKIIPRNTTLRLVRRMQLKIRE